LKNTWLVPALCLASSIAAAQQPARTVPRNSFLSQPVTSTKDLLRQFDTNPNVQRRYMRAYGRSAPEVRSIIQDLRPKKLTSTATYPIGYYKQDGSWNYKQGVLRKGTVVFVGQDGRPVLKENCGNPLLIIPPPQRPPAVTSVPVPALPAPMETPMETPPAQLTFTGRPMMPDVWSPPSGSLPVPDMPAIPETPDADVPITPPILNVPETSLPKIRITSRPPSWMLGLLPLLFLRFGGGGSSDVGPTGGGGGGFPPGGGVLPPGGGGTPIPPAGGTEPPPTPGGQEVPEPGTWALLAGCASMGVLAYRRRRVAGSR
jgi:hypothetical protein